MDQRKNAAANGYDGGRDASTTASDCDPYGHLKLLDRRPSGCAGAVILAPLQFSSSTGFRGSHTVTGLTAPFCRHVRNQTISRPRQKPA